jgi:hypothetical protein
VGVVFSPSFVGCGGLRQRMLRSLLRLGEGRVFGVVGGVFLAYFHCFGTVAWSQIYARLPFSTRHALLGQVLCHRPFHLPVAQVKLVAGVRRVACTLQRGFRSLVLVTVTLRYFLVLHGGDGAFGDVSFD